MPNITFKKGMAYFLAGYALFRLINRIRHRVKLARRARQTNAVLITGCDTGFGRKAAEQLSSKGIPVFAGCLTAKGVTELDNLDRKNLCPIRLDVTKEESVAKVVEEIQRILSEHKEWKFWALINNAGVLRTGPFDAQSMADYRLQMEVNYFGIVHMCRAFVPLLRQSKGRIVNVASVAGFSATPDTSSYNGSKFAVQGLTDSLRRELSEWGIKVMTIEPGVMKTHLWDTTLEIDQVIQRQYDSCPPDIQALYGIDYFYAKHKAAATLVDLFKGDPSEVVNSMERAVTCRWPLKFYTVGRGVNMFRLLRALPTCISDWLVEMQVKVLMAGVKPKALE